MAKVNKQELATALTYLYQSTLDFNRIGGKSIHPDYTESQKKVVVEEAKETILALIDKDLKERVDGLLDVCVTASFMVMIQDGNDDITKDHTGLFNVEGKSDEVLAGTLLTCLLKEDWIGVLESAEDLLYHSEGDTIHNVYEVANSNLSKYVPVVLLDDPEAMCETIEAEGRYTGVEYSTSKKSSGEEVYVFTATYDVKEKTGFDKPKIVKPKGFFKEPQLIV